MIALTASPSHVNVCSPEFVEVTHPLATGGVFPLPLFGPLGAFGDGDRGLFCVSMSTVSALTSDSSCTQAPSVMMKDRKRIEEILSDTKRGSYAEYVAAFRRLTKKESLSALIKKAGSKDFTAWAKTAFVESESQND